MSIWDWLSAWWNGKPRDAESLAEFEDAKLIGRNSINRSVLVVRPAEPFKRWAAKVSGEKLGDARRALSDDHSAYLVPREDSLEVAPEVLEAVFEEIFERELLSWHTDRTQWPAPRTFEMFLEWFELETCGMVVDLIEDSIEHERN